MLNALFYNPLLVEVVLVKMVVVEGDQVGQKVEIWLTFEIQRLPLKWRGSVAAERPCDLAQSSVGTGIVQQQNVLSDSSCPQAPNWRFNYIKEFTIKSHHGEM